MVYHDHYRVEAGAGRKIGDKIDRYLIKGAGAGGGNRGDCGS